MTLPRATLASALGISRIMVYKLQQRGMPVDDVEAAKAWRESNLDATKQGGAMRAKENRQPDMGYPTSVSTTTASTSPAPRSKTVKSVKNQTLSDAAEVADASNQRVSAPPPAAPRTPPSSAPDAPTTATGRQPSDFQTEQILKARAERELAQLKVAKETGRVIDRDAAKRAIYEFMRAYRERLLTIPSRVAADLIGVGEVREAEHIIFDGYVKVVTEFENEMPGLLARMTA